MRRQRLSSRSPPSTGRRAVISGTEQAVLALAAQLRPRAETKRLGVSHAFHSPLMEPILAEFQTEIEGLSFAPPDPDPLQDLTGELLSDEQATDRLLGLPGARPRALRRRGRDLGSEGHQHLPGAGPRGPAHRNGIGLPGRGSRSHLIADPARGPRKRPPDRRPGPNPASAGQDADLRALSRCQARPPAHLPLPAPPLLDLGPLGSADAGSLGQAEARPPAPRGPDRRPRRRRVRAQRRDLPGRPPVAGRPRRRRQRPPTRHRLLELALCAASQLQQAKGSG